ncbi:MAG TPA: DUF5916 domain-containing protein [Gemmatimonadaceae bacterium]|nr:DUF5916 domain-containing protein [Gemmatimonadaceae bacterium]
MPVLPRVIASAVLLSLAAVPAGAQQLVRRGDAPRPSAATVARAIKATSAITIDGVGADAAWAEAPAVDGFRVFDPVEDGEPAMRTEARFAYDERNLYVLVRAFDPRPDSIMALLSRRDERTQSDYIRVIVDSYHDRRTGYQFMVNPAGVKRDLYLYNDSQEDISWDAVWDVQTTIDSLGWLAEFRIPLSQLRYPQRETHTFGVAVHREIARTNERSSWPLWRRSQFGIASQLGEMQGITGIASPRRLEVLPYSVQANQTVERGADFGRTQRGTVGADIKYGLSSNLTLDAAINPDFGQVEADPAVLNLSAFEQFFGERRPFFLEGTGILRFDQDCNDGSCTGLFYSRRIGRAPQLGFLSGEPASVPTATTILGAAKITGRLPSGTSVGILNAVADQEMVGDTLVVEPRSNYFVARVNQDLRQGRSGIGAILTAVHRDLDARGEPYLRREAYTGGIDFRHRFGATSPYNLSGNMVGSVVRGSEEAIAATQRSSVHLYQRPDDDLAYDPTRTSLSGYGLNIGLNKDGGGITRFWTGGWYKSPGLEINDVGFMTNVNSMGWSNWFAFVFQEPKAFYRRLQINFNQWNGFFVDGMNTGVGGNVNLNVNFKNMWFMYAGVGSERPSYCGSCLRGGPALREDANLNSWFGISGDSRRSLVPGLDMGYNKSDGGRSFNWRVGPYVNLRVASRFSASLGMNYSRNVDDRQWLSNFGAVGIDTTHYTVGHLEQKTLSLTTRLNFTASPTLSVQFYGQPFVSAGEYSDWREVADARSRDFDTRFRPFPLGNDPSAYDFNFKQFRSNTVIRWEYLPGSTLYLVWQQGREQYDQDRGQFTGMRDYRNLFGAYPRNTFLIKASYWLSL